jgi:type III secretion protein J
MRSERLLALTLLLAAAVGCAKQELYSNLHERDANEMMAVLSRNGISANKVAGEEEGTWNLSVPSSSFAQAVESLSALGYPKNEFGDMGKIFQKSGLVSSPSEERIRFIYALSQEISKTLSQIDGVLWVSVQIVLPNNDPFGDEVKPSSAAVFIKHRQDADLESSIAKIKELVIASIEGLGPENVTVALFPAEEMAPIAGYGEGAPTFKNVMSLELAPTSVNKFWAIVGSLALVTLLAIAFGVFALLRGRSRMPTSGAA